MAAAAAVPAAAAAGAAAQAKAAAQTAEAAGAKGCWQGVGCAHHLAAHEPAQCRSGAIWGGGLDTSEGQTQTVVGADNSSCGQDIWLLPTRQMRPAGTAQNHNAQAGRDREWGLRGVPCARRAGSSFQGQQLAACACLCVRSSSHCGFLMCLMPSVCLSACLPAHLPVCLHACLPVCCPAASYIEACHPLHWQPGCQHRVGTHRKGRGGARPHLGH